MPEGLLKYLATAPVVATIWMLITAGILIEFNRFFPDLLLHPYVGSCSRLLLKRPSQKSKHLIEF